MPVQEDIDSRVVRKDTPNLVEIDTCSTTAAGRECGACIGKKQKRLEVNAQTTSEMTRASVPTYFQRISKHFTAKERHHLSPSGYSEFNLQCTLS